MTFIEDPDEIAKLTRGQLVAYVQDGLLLHALRSREAIEHDFLRASAAALDVIRRVGQQEVRRMEAAKREKKTPHAMNAAVEGVVDALRSTLIAEILTRSHSGAAEEAAA